MTRRINWSRVLVYGLVPTFVLLLAIAAGLLKWHDSSIRHIERARDQSVAAAKESTDAILTFRYDTIDHDVAATRERLTGGFLDTYMTRTRNELVPRAKQERIVATATVPDAAPEITTPNHAVVLVFISQTVKIGDAPPMETGSRARVTLDKLGERWLISGFDHY
jgi:Mce-associated membrane protein